MKMSSVATRTQCAMTFSVPELPNLLQGIHGRLMDGRTFKWRNLYCQPAA